MTRLYRNFASAVLVLLLAAWSTAGTPGYYQTKTPYTPQQDASTYEPAPTGFSPVHTQLVARHGSRGLTSAKYDLAILDMWTKAQAEGALTELGKQLGPDLEKLTKGNALLGYGVPGIRKPGYGNLTQMGIGEHRQLAARMYRRMEPLFNGLSAGGPRKIVVVNSGEDRARESGEFFVEGMIKARPELASLVTLPPAPGPYPAVKPVAQAAGSNRFLLYFHALKPATDEVTDPADPYYATYQASRAYQKYLDSPAYAAAQEGIKRDPTARATARAVLERLFAPAFVDKLDTGTYKFSNIGGGTFTSADGRLTITVKGDGKTVLSNAVEAAATLYELYIISPSLKADIGVDFDPYILPEHARLLEQTSDGANFYLQGPGTVESNGVSVKIAQYLIDDFFAEVDRIARGDRSHAAKLRFGHAETTIPFAAILGLKDLSEPLPARTVYSHANSPWRGANAAPMAANVQWDVFADAGGTLIVKMYHNEREVDFKAACDGARVGKGSRFYVYAGLCACYGYAATK